MPWLCYLKHTWLYIDGNRRRCCLQCQRYQTLSVWNDEKVWLND